MSKTAFINIDPPSIIEMHRKPVRVKDGAVVGLRAGTAVVPVVDLERPEVDYRTHTLTRAEPVAYSDRVEIGWVMTQRTNEQIIAEIKQRANEVITALFPITKQQNMQAHSIEMIASGDAASVEATYGSAWNWIKAVRVKSNELEQALIDNGTLPDFSALEVPWEG